MSIAPIPATTDSDHHREGDPTPHVGPGRTPEFPIASCHVERWVDPLVDRLGLDPRSAYVERFWLPVLGPSTVWFLRRVADELDRSPDGVTVDLVEMAQAIGVGMRGGRNSPMMRTIDRCCRFGAARSFGAGHLAVRRRLAPLTRAQTERLSPALRAEHDAWLAAPKEVSEFGQLQQRARELALSMLELGDDAGTVERQLHRWRFHPAIAFDAVRWGLGTQVLRVGGEPTPPATASPAEIAHRAEARAAIAAATPRIGATRRLSVVETD